MSNTKLYHKFHKDIFLDTTDNKLYRQYSSNHIEELIPENFKRSNVIRYKSRVLSYVKLIYECFNQIYVLNKKLVCVYKDNSTAPSDIITILKSEWLKGKYRAGERTETLTKLKSYLSANAYKWRNNAVVNIDTGEEYPSGKEASIALNLTTTAVPHGIRYNHTVGGYHWKYKDPIKQSEVDAKRASLKPVKRL